MLKILLLFVLTATNNSMGAKILAVFPVPLISHQLSYKTLIEELARRGHEITLVRTTDTAFSKETELENITEINLPDAAFTIYQNYSSITESNQHMDIVYKMSRVFKALNQLFVEKLNTVEITNLIKEKHSYFDLILLDASIVSVLSLSHMFKAPVIFFNSIGTVLDNYKIVGAPTHPLLYPSIFRRRIYNLTVWEKVTELYLHLRLEVIFRSIERRVDLMLKSHFGPDFPPLNELKNNVDMLFLNINPIWAENHPVPPGVVFIGGMQPRDTQELSQDLLSFLNMSKYGVVYLSFGNVIRPSRLPPKVILIILNVLSEIPYDVLLKWDLDSLPGAPKNIKIFQWLPQTSLLKHPKIKLFITQGGLQSTEDAINAGVPLIGVPMFGDQWYNTEKYVHFHIGMQVDIASLSEENLMNAIRTVIADESYRQNVAELRTLMYDQPQTPLERAVWWTEHVLRHGGAKHLRAPAANMSWAEYYEVNFILKLLFITCVIFVVFIVLVTIGFRYVVKSFADTKKKMS